MSTTDRSARLTVAGFVAAGLAIALAAAVAVASVDQLHQALAVLMATLDGAGADMQAVVARTAQRTRVVIALTGVLALGALAAAALSVRRQLGRRAAAERALRAREAELHQMLDALPLGVLVFDRDGRRRFVNRRAPEVVGRPIDDGQVLERAPEEHQVYVAGTDERYPVERLPVSRALAGEMAHAADMEIRARGTPVPVEVWAAPIKDEAGRITAAVAAFVDISERVQARAERDALNAELARRIIELEALNRQLAALNLDLEGFSYSVSHDLRAPLRAIDGFSRILLEDHGAELPAEGVRRLAVIRERTQHMARLIDDLLAFSRASRRQPAPEMVEMKGVVERVLTELSTPGRERVQFVVGPLPPAVADPGLLRQVWENLVDNAVKYTSRADRPRVELGGEAGADEVRYWVGDNGVGFDMAHADQLFRVFQRLHRADEFPGTGIGLALAERIVQHHGGRMWAEARPGEGATFFFSLPSAG